MKASPPRAVLFDFNGVILDDEPLHYEALRRVLAEEGVSLGREAYFASCLGFNDAECFRWGLGSEERIRRAGGLEGLIRRKSAAYRELLGQGIPFFPGVLDLVRDIAARDRLLAVASMALRSEILFVLERAEVLDLFEVIVAGDEVIKTKPDPEVYRKALEHLNARVGGPRGSRIRPEECLVIEDSRAGIGAGKAAGMRVLAVAHTEPAERLGEADWVFPSLEGLTAARLEALFTPGDRQPHIPG